MDSGGFFRGTSAEQDNRFSDKEKKLLKKTPDPKIIQIRITGFLADDSASFMESLWQLLLTAQAAPGGIPEEFLKDVELMSAKALAEENRIKEALDKARTKIGNTSRIETHGAATGAQPRVSRFSDVDPNVQYGLNAKKKEDDDNKQPAGGDGGRRQYKRFDVRPPTPPQDAIKGDQTPPDRRLSAPVESGDKTPPDSRTTTWIQ
eukprot:gene5751-6658_t